MGATVWVVLLINGLTLAGYAGVAYCLWHQAQRTAARTEELARQTRDAAILQMVAILAHQADAERARGEDTGLEPEVRGLTAKQLWRAYRRLFPDHWEGLEFLKIGGQDIGV